MPNILAKTVLTLVAGSLQPVPLPNNAPNVAKLYDAQSAICQLQQQIQQMNPQLGQIQIEPFQLSAPAPSYIEVGPNIAIQPYGPSFKFNGLTVYVEPVATVSASLAPPATHP